MKVQQCLHPQEEVPIDVMILFDVLNMNTKSLQDWTLYVVSFSAH